MACIGEGTSILVVGPVGTFAIAGMTWFYSSRRRLFIRTFVPRDELHAYVRSLPRGSDFRKGLRAIASIEFLLATLLGFVFLWCYGYP